MAFVNDLDDFRGNIKPELLEEYDRAASTIFEDPQSAQSQAGKRERTGSISPSAKLRS